jgi:hypothetical protein
MALISIYIGLPKIVKLAIANIAFVSVFAASSSLQGGVRWIISVAVGGALLSLVPLEPKSAEDPPL